jgi:Reverse transcriptase (RNA-dependent DNA polymerase)
MEPMSNAQLRKIDLRKAAEDEASAARNLLPREPWQDLVLSKPGHVASWVSARLLAGARNGRATIVNARKAHQAIRPVPIVGIAERIALRALTEWVLATHERPARDSDAYRAFVHGPIRYALQSLERPYRLDLGNPPIEYVVQADIAAFYQYVDHNVLLEELQMQTENIEGSRLLVELLADVQGASYGLPQLLDASDRLAEVYMGIIERELRRRGLPLWRYNDDFRFAVNGYAKALQVVEDLSTIAHSVGLIVNDGKTTILKFDTYFQRLFWRPDLQGEDFADADNIDIGFSEYSDEDEVQLLGKANAFLERIDSGEPGGINLKDLAFDEVRELRSALSTFKRNVDDSALPFIQDIARFVPQLTPRLCDYLLALSETDGIIEEWLGVTGWSGGFNVWQRAWLVYVARRSGFTSDPRCQEWILSQLRHSEGTLLHAESALALAEANEISFEDLDEYLRTQPESLIPWYLIAIKTLRDVPDDRLAAVKQSYPLGRLLLSN